MIIVPHFTFPLPWSTKHHFYKDIRNVPLKIMGHDDILQWNHTDSILVLYYDYILCNS